MRTRPRPRHAVHPLLLGALRPAFRYSPGRDAYVLRVVGQRRGPVLVRRPTPAVVRDGARPTA